MVPFLYCTCTDTISHKKLSLFNLAITLQSLVEGGNEAGKRHFGAQGRQVASGTVGG